MAGIINTWALQLSFTFLFLANSLPFSSCVMGPGSKPSQPELPGVLHHLIAGIILMDDPGRLKGHLRLVQGHEGDKNKLHNSMETYLAIDHSISNSLESWTKHLSIILIGFTFGFLSYIKNARNRKKKKGWRPCSLHNPVFQSELATCSEWSTQLPVLCSAKSACPVFR